MRTLSSALTSAQVALNKPPIWKVVLSRTSQTTRGYANTRILKISHTETPKGDTVELILNNSDGALTALDFEHYQAVISYGFDTKATRSAWAANTAYVIDDIRRPVTANGYQYRCSVAGTSHATTEPTWPTSLGVTVTDGTVTWEMDGDSGEEYSRTAPLRVRAQELHSGRGILRVILRPKGILEQLAEDTAEAVYTQTSTDTNTVKTLITGIAGATLSPFTNYTAYTVTYDSEDSLIDVFIPKDYFSVKLNETRLAKIEELLAYTGCKMRVENDGKLHIFDPTISGTTYNYEYKFKVSGSHNFWNKTIRLRSVIPNKEVVKDKTYSGSATSATSFDLAPKTHTTEVRLASNAQGDAIAAAKIESYELDAERGFAIVPMNVGQELWDYVKVTDSRQGDTRIGNVQFIKRDVEIHFDKQPLTWTMMIGFGKVSVQSILANLQTAAGVEVTKDGTQVAARLDSEQILTLFDRVIDYVQDVDLRSQWLAAVANVLDQHVYINAAGDLCLLPGVGAYVVNLGDVQLSSDKYLGLLGAAADAEVIWFDSAGTYNHALVPQTDGYGNFGKLTKQFKGGYFKTRLKIPVGTDLFD